MLSGLQMQKSHKKSPVIKPGFCLALRMYSEALLFELLRLNVPDVTGVFPDGPVGAEFAGLADIDPAFFIPGLAVQIIFGNEILDSAIVFEVA